MRQILQNTTAIFFTKCDSSLLQNASGFLLQNATVIVSCDNFITKCDSYYNMRRLWQIATVQRWWIVFAEGLTENGSNRDYCLRVSLLQTSNAQPAETELV